jgi:FKBP-type peptidyl-prolyl cis-trans isomerase FkpA
MRQGARIKIAAAPSLADLSRPGLGLLFSLAALALLLQAQAQAQTPAPAPSAGPAQASEPLKTGSTRSLPSGVEVTLTRAGRAPLSYPAPTDSVKVHYEGTFEDGRVFDSSYERKQPATFPLNRVIPCWTQGVQQIPVGGAATLVCPAATAYGERGAGGGKIPPNTPLRFKVELLEIISR